MGSPDVRQINGIGGGDSLTSKVIIVSPSNRPGIDLEYLFAQVAVDNASVDTTPNCGNMLSGVGPFAIDRGLIRAADPTTKVRIFNINTKKVIEAVIPTPGGKVTFEGDTRIDGVPGTGAGIVLNFLDAEGAKTGKVLPTGNPKDIIAGIELSCVDFADPAAPDKSTIEHPSGKLETRIGIEHPEGATLPRIRTAGIVRTARPLLSGMVYIHERDWPLAA